MNNKYLRRKLEESDVKEENVLGFYWDGLHEDEGLVRCSLSEMPRILSHDYILLRCESCGKEFYKRVIDLLPTCHHCNQQDHWNSMKEDWRLIISDALDSGLELLGYLEDGYGTEFISDTKLDSLPDFGCSDYIRFKCKECGEIFDRRLNRLKVNYGCPACNTRLRHFNSRLNWIPRILDFLEEYNCQLIGYYDQDNLIKINSINELPSLIKHNFIQCKCNYCGEEFYRGLYHLDYGHICKPNKSDTKPRIFKLGSISTRFGDLKYYSSYEETFINLLKDLTEVTSMISQPDEYIIDYSMPDGTPHEYHPDFFINIFNKKFVVEIKPASLICSEMNQAKITASIKFFKNTDITYIVITDDELLDKEALNEVILRFKTEDKLQQLRERNL
jgi:formylmethanofuran dehydrogenase subunit E